MEEENPLQINVLSSKYDSEGKSCYSNAKGRPSLAKMIKFGPQPKSIISQSLLKMGNYNCKITIKDEVMNPNNTTNIAKDNIHGHAKHPAFTESCLSNDIKFQQNVQYKRRKYNRNNSFLQFLNHEGFEDSQVVAPPNKLDLAQTTFTCSICSYECTDKIEHKKHLSCHKSKQYSCDYPACPYTCKLSSNLTKHRRVHTADKPYLCDQCTFRTNFVNSLKVHKRLHANEKPYGCTQCEYKCNSVSNLKKHCLHRHT